MARTIPWVLGGLIWLLGAAGPVASLPAQEAVLGELYGTGVHAYFAHDYLKAHESLTAAILGGTTDPRAYYFRGLTYVCLGRSEDAALDFQTGASLESRDVNKFYNVSRALERVQGGGRAALEQYRVNARMAALAEAEQLHRARYEEIRRQEGRVLQQQAELIPPGAESAGKPAGVENVDPFANPAAAPQGAPAPQAAMPETAPAAEPEAKPVPQPAGPPPEAPAAAPEMPGAPPEEPGAPPPATPTPAPAAEDPFAPKPAAKSTQTPPAEADPFAGAAAKPAAEPSADKKSGGIPGAMLRAVGKAVVDNSGDKPAETAAPETASPTPPPAEPAADPAAADPFAPPSPGGKAAAKAAEKPAAESAAKPDAADPFAPPPTATPAEQNLVPEPPGGGKSADEKPADAKPADANDPFAS